MQKMYFVSKFLHFGYEIRKPSSERVRAKKNKKPRNYRVFSPSLEFLRNREMKFEESLKDDRK